MEELVVEDSRIPKMWSKRLHNDYHMSGLRSMDLSDCMIEAIEDHSFYKMSLK